MAAHVNMVNLSMISCLSTLIFDKRLIGVVVVVVVFVETSILGLDFTVFALLKIDSNLETKLYKNKLDFNRRSKNSLLFYLNHVK